MLLAQAMSEDACNKHDTGDEYTLYVIDLYIPPPPFIPTNSCCGEILATDGKSVTILPTDYEFENRN
jgi:hypothetical protein